MNIYTNICILLYNQHQMSDQKNLFHFITQFFIFYKLTLIANTLFAAIYYSF